MRLGANFSILRNRRLMGCGVWGSFGFNRRHAFTGGGAQPHRRVESPNEQHTRRQWRLSVSIRTDRQVRAVSHLQVVGLPGDIVTAEDCRCTKAVWGTPTTFLSSALVCACKLEAVVAVGSSEQPPDSTLGINRHVSNNGSRSGWQTPIRCRKVLLLP